MLLNLDRFEGDGEKQAVLTDEAGNSHAFPATALPAGSVAGEWFRLEKGELTAAPEITAAYREKVRRLQEKLRGRKER